MGDSMQPKQLIVGAILLVIGFIVGKLVPTAKETAPDVRVVAFDACEHDRDSDWTCPDSLKRLFPDAASITSGSVTLQLTSGEQAVFDVGPRTNALFLTAGAVENFLVRYYDATDATKAEALRAYMRSAPR